MHIVVTANTSWNIWNFRRSIAAALIHEGHRVTVLAPPDNSVARLKEMGCHFVPLAMDAKGLNPLKEWALLRRLGREFTVLRPDAVLSYTIKNNIFGAMAAKRSGIPFIPNVSGLGTAFLSGGLLQRAAESLSRSAFSGLSVVFFQNSDDRALFMSRGLVRDEQARLLPGSGVDLSHFVATPLPGNRQPVFLMIARLLRDKGVVEYVEAARRLRLKYPEARFRLLGATGVANRSAIDRPTVDSWVAEGVIDYLGTCDDVRPHIAAADCIVLPSYYREGTPRTLLEGAAMARPIITTDSVGCRDTIEDGISGFLCAPRDVASLAERMETFCNLPLAVRSAMGAAGRRRMEAIYDERIVIDHYLRAIAELTGRPPGRA